jgi:arylsulfatase A-like enzyme
MTFLLALVACDSNGPDSPTAPEDSAPDAGDDTAPDLVSPGLAGLQETGARNLILIHADTLRRDRLTMYGAGRDTLPNSLSAGWLAVDGMYVPTSWTVPSTVSLLTHQHVEDHGITHLTDELAYPAHVSATTMAQRFSAAGYATYFASGNQALQGVVGLTNGFDQADLVRGGELRDLDRLSGDFLSWLDTLEPGRPFFILAQPMDTHGPYDPRDPYLGTFSDPDAIPFELTAPEEEQVADFHAAWIAADEAEKAALQDALLDVYDEGVLKLDGGLQRVLTGLAERGLEDETLVVVVGDHGETLNDEGDGNFGHGGKVRQELVVVPFLIHHPRVAPQTVPCLSSNVDVGPTLYAALGIEIPPSEDVGGAPLQDGCRTVVRASTFMNERAERQVAEIMVGSGAGALRVDCLNDATYRYNLLDDPGGNVSVPDEALPDAAALHAAVQVFDQDLRSAFGESAGCPSVQ